MIISSGEKFRQAVEASHPLQIIGTINAYLAIMAERTGFQALYLSGGGVANLSHGLPDLGVTTLKQVTEDAKRITNATELPLLVDIDTGFEDIPGTIKAMEEAGVAAVHIEDQPPQKRCGHRPDKKTISAFEMQDRIKACVDARENDQFVIMARSDAYANEGLQAFLDRCHLYIEAGADMIFAEAISTFDDYHPICETLKVPILANMTEFGKTELYHKDQLAAQGIKMVLYPRSIDRAMNKAALGVLKDILKNGQQHDSLVNMQTRDELYDFLDYLKFESEAK